MLVLAIDGKVMRGAWSDGNGQFTLFSAMIHEVGVTVAQAQVPADTNEITQVKALLDEVTALSDKRVVVTMDAAHTQRETAQMWLPPPTEDEIALFNISFVQPTGTLFKLRRMLPIFAAPLKTGEVLLVTATRRPISEQESADLAGRRTAIAERIADAGAIGEAVTDNMRALLHSASEDDGRLALDLAVAPTLAA